MNNQEFLTEYILRDLTLYLMEDENLDMPSAMAFIYNSEVYIKLMDQETGLYIESSAYVYELLKEEYRMGKLATNGG